MNKTLLPVLLACTFAAACTSSDTAPDRIEGRPGLQAAPPASAVLPGHIKTINDIPYKTVGGRSLKLDLYLPSADTRRAPVVVWVHGGAWKRGDKESITRNSRLLNALLNEGYAVASVGYRLSGEAVFPAQIQDVNDAVQYLWQNAGRYGIDNGRIALAGRSAGAHLAALAAASNTAGPPSFITAAPAPGFKVNALVGFFGPYDLSTLSDGKNRNSTAQSPEGLLLGGEPSARPEAAKQASPVSYVGRHMPPTLLLHGTNDRNVPHSQSETLKSHLDAAGIPNELYLAEGARHGDPVFDNELYVGKVTAFLRKYFPIR